MRYLAAKDSVEPDPADGLNDLSCFQPGRLWSLWDMLKKYGAVSLVAGRVIELTKAPQIANRNTMAELEMRFGELLAALKDRPLSKNMQRTFDMFLAHEKTLERDDLNEDQKNLLAREAFAQMCARLEDEFGDQAFYYVRPDLAPYYEDGAFGPELEAKFADAKDDLDEAGKCLALGRNKGCVCHLMLAMEIALRALGVKLGATVQSADGKWLTWLVITNNIEPKIKAMAEGSEKTAWWEVHSMLTSVGRAWRNPSMHPARSYDEPQARKVYDAVKGFMTDLAALV